MNEIFSRQILMLPDKCQEKLKKAVLLVAGVGGLGSVASELLVRVGIGKLYIVDKGVIDLPDLNRQIHYTMEDLGKKKVEIAEKKLSKINNFTKIISIDSEVDENFKLPSDIVGIMDCFDNLKARYIIDDLIKGTNIFLVHGAIREFYGQVTTIIPEKTKTLREILKNIPDKDEPIPVIAPTPSVVASIQVMEAVKLLCNFEDVLLNKILFIDLKDYTFEMVKL